MLTSANFWKDGAIFGHQIKVYILKLFAGKFDFIWTTNKGIFYD